MSMSDIVERLRDNGKGLPIQYEAADEIERLRTQCEGLAQSAMNNGQDLLLKEAELERLRAALDVVQIYFRNVDRSEREEAIYVVARRALEGK